MKSKKVSGKFYRIAFLLFLSLLSLQTFAEKPVVKKIMFFGDSTTGWLAERLQAYGEKNGFEVATVVWDGATMRKYANNAAKLKQYITASHPDVVFVSLGMNEMGTAKPETQLAGHMQKIKNTIGNIPIIWLGPVSWPASTKCALDGSTKCALANSTKCAIGDSTKRLPPVERTVRLR